MDYIRKELESVTPWSGIGTRFIGKYDLDDGIQYTSRQAVTVKLKEYLL